MSTSASSSYDDELTNLCHVIVHVVYCFDDAAHAAACDGQGGGRRLQIGPREFEIIRAPFSTLGGSVLQYFACEDPHVPVALDQKIDERFRALASRTLGRLTCAEAPADYVPQRTFAKTSRPLPNVAPKLSCLSLNRLPDRGQARIENACEFPLQLHVCLLSGGFESCTGQRRKRLALEASASVKLSLEGVDRIYGVACRDPAKPVDNLFRPGEKCSAPMHHAILDLRLE